MWRKLVLIVPWIVVPLVPCLGFGTAAYYVHFRKPEKQSDPRPFTQYEHFDRAADGKPICPKCGRSDDVRLYLYGLLRDAPPEGMVSGGCLLASDSPEYRCGHCETNFGLSSQYKLNQEAHQKKE